MIVSSFDRCRFVDRLLRELLRNVTREVKHLLRRHLQNQGALLIHELIYGDLSRWLYLHFDFILLDCGSGRPIFRLLSFPG